MPNSDQVERLLQKALQSQDFPPIPAGILNVWRPVPSNQGMKWLWIMPSLVFIFGISVGVWLAPLGLSNAFVALKDAMLGIWQALPMATIAWATAVIMAIIVFAFDGLRGHLARLK